MNELPQRTLISIVRAEGSAILNDPQRLYNSLQSACGQFPNEIMALMAALRQGVPGDLLAAAKNTAVVWPAATGAWAQRLQDQERMPADFAAWAVDSWALALGVGPAPAPAPLSTPPLAATPAPNSNQTGFPGIAPHPGPPPPGPFPPSVSQPPGPPYSSHAQPPKAAKAGPIIVIVVLAVIGVAGWYVYYVAFGFDRALVGNWTSSTPGSVITWDELWDVNSSGKIKITEATADAGRLEVLNPQNILLLHSDHLGDISVGFRFENQLKLHFNGRMLSPGGDTVWNWSAEDRGIPDPNRYTFVGTWILSTPRDGLGGDMRLTIDYNSRYKLSARYSDDATMKAADGAYQIQGNTGTYKDAGKYRLDNADQIEMMSSDPSRGTITWNRAHP
jgi:hypothetical protein